VPPLPAADNGDNVDVMDEKAAAAVMEDVMLGADEILRRL
jgi:hypothetical protein